MKQRDLSKLQIRAEITLLLQKYASIDEMSKEQQDKCLEKLKSIKDKQYVVEILAKELGRVDYKRGQIISVLLQTLGTLEELKNVLWSYIKSHHIADEIKDLAGITLKYLGDTTDPDELLNYFNNPKEIVDKETQKLLEIASINPEAQIDFLDFLFALPKEEQENLINSLEDDYTGEYLVNVIVPALESRNAPHLENKFIEILGETRSAKAVPILKEISESSKNEVKKKNAKKSLNMLKLAGVDIDNASADNDTSNITKVSKIYECHTSIPDGMGNQAIIISRIKPNKDIIMMNVVVNDVHGILDCFGFYGISVNDFRRIVERFQEKTTRFYISPKTCKFMLDNAEKTNKEGSIAIPYEYTAWKSLISDIEADDVNLEELCLDWINKDYINEVKLLYKFPDFKHWFMEEEDHSIIQRTLNKILNEIRLKKGFYTENPESLKSWIDEEVSQLAFLVFDDVMRGIFKRRLQNIAYLLDNHEVKYFRDIAATLAWAIDTDNGLEPSNIPFFKAIISRTVMEFLLRYEYEIDTAENKQNKTWKGMQKDKNIAEDAVGLKEKSIRDIINVLYNNQ